MSERDGYPPGVPCWVDTAQPDPEAAVGFYGELFGWEFVGPGPMAGPGGGSDPPGRYLVARLRGRDVAGVSAQPPEGAPAVPAWSTYFSVDSADDSAAKALGAGGSAIVEPFDALPAGRMAVLCDPQGAVFCAWEAGNRKGAQLVNEPGAWSMSVLNARDPEGAKAFYGDVFGWNADTFDLGGAEITLLRLEGFEGGEPEQPVPRDLVATMVPIGDEAPGEDVAAQWSVDFWVDDVDAAAEAAARLGGKVIAPPYDIPGAGMRQAVLGDPQGAAFSVTRVVAAP